MTTSPKEEITRLQHPTAEDIVEGRMQFVYPVLVYVYHHALQVQKLHLTRGAFLREIPLPMHYEDLILEGYRRADFVIAHPFTRRIFVSSELHLINCPGFTHAEHLSQVDSVAKRPLFSSNLCFLKLTGCNNFIIGALKNMVKVRGTNSPWDFLGGRNLWSVEVSEYGTALVVEDGDLITDYLMCFSWDDTQFLGTF